jgi:hypothetical protein
MEVGKVYHFKCVCITNHTQKGIGGTLKKYLGKKLKALDWAGVTCNQRPISTDIPIDVEKRWSLFWHTGCGAP